MCFVWFFKIYLNFLETALACKAVYFPFYLNKILKLFKCVVQIEETLELLLIIAYILKV